VTNLAIKVYQEANEMQMPQSLDIKEVSLSGNQLEPQRLAQKSSEQGWLGEDDK